MRPETDRSDEGFALVAVLMFMLVVSAVIVPFAVSARTRLLIAHNMSEQKRLNLLADGLVTILSNRLRGLPPQIRGNGDAVQCKAGDYAFSVRIQDHRGLIDLNASDAAQLARGFEAMGVDAAEANALADATIASRNPPNAFSNHETEAPRHVRLKAAPFESVSELAYLTSAGDLSPAEIHRLFTVHSKVGVVDPNLAPTALRQKLAGNSSAVGSSTAGTTYSLQVTITKASSGIVGNAGYVLAQTEGAHFGRTSKLPPMTVAAEGAQPLPCAPLFGDRPAQLVAEWADE